jgi:putative tricarboxylic transport membrane protein
MIADSLGALWTGFGVATQPENLMWSFFGVLVGNLIGVLPAPLIGLWVRVLRLPYRYLFPSALFFIAVGVFSTNNSLFEVGEVLVFGVAGAVFVALRFPIAPILLGYVLGPMVEENFRRAMLISRGDLAVFVERPISGVFIALAALLVLVQIFFAVRKATRRSSTTRRRCSTSEEPTAP